MNFASPQPFQVLQRDAQGRAPLVIDVREIPPAATRLVVTLSAVEELARKQAQEQWTLPLDGSGSISGRIGDVPTGGPWRLAATALDAQGGVLATCFVDPLYAGDLWALGGQSNMAGTSLPMDEAATPSPFVTCQVATEPWRIAQDPMGGWYTGPGVEFGKTLWQELGVPIGLIQGSVNGSSIYDWDPAVPDSLFWKMIGYINLAGGRIRGLAWYQGESDAFPNHIGDYAQRTAQMVAALRANLADPAIAFPFAQIGPKITDQFPDSCWLTIRQEQYLMENAIPRSLVATASDLQIWDTVHLTTDSSKRMGRRLARLASILAYHDGDQKPGPRLARVCRMAISGKQDGKPKKKGDRKEPVLDDPRALRLVFSGVNGTLVLPTDKADVRFLAVGGAEIPWTSIELLSANEVVFRFLQDVPDTVSILWAQTVTPIPTACVRDADDFGVPSFRTTVTLPSARAGRPRKIKVA